MEAEGWVEPDDLDRQRPAQPRKAAAEREGDAEYLADVEAQPLRHALVVDGGADLRAQPRPFKAEDQQRRDDQRHDDEEDAIDAERYAGDHDRAAQP